MRLDEQPSCLLPEATRCLSSDAARVVVVRKSLLETLVELLGPGPTQKLIAQFGGARVWIPARCEPGSRLAELLGADPAARLCELFGGDYMQIPTAVTRPNVHGRIAELHRQGCKINEIARAVGRSRRTVFRLLGRSIADLRSKRPA